MDVRDYLASERFIFDELVGKAASINAKMKARWRNGLPITPHSITWPSIPIRTDEGVFITQQVISALPEDQDEQRALLLAMVKRTKAYALVLIEKRAQALQVLFESGKGTRLWTTPIQLHGDVYVLGDTHVQENTDGLGLLWLPTTGTA